MFLTAPVSLSALVDELLWNTVKFHVESSLHFQCYSKYSRHFYSFHVINTMKFASFVSVYMVAFPYCKWCSQVWLRWRSIRTCVHLLLQELQNYNSLQNKHWQENVDSHKKKDTPHPRAKEKPQQDLPQKGTVQLISRVWLFVTPWIAARQDSLSITNFRSSLKLMSIESVMPSSHLILCRPLLLLPPIPPSIRVFPMSQLFTWGGQSTGVSALASVLPMNT